MGINNVDFYFSDSDVIASLRQRFDREEMYTINFKYWLNTMKKTKDGLVVQVENRKFLIHPYTGLVLKELV